MELNVQENLIEITQRDTVHIEKELDNYLETSEGQKIKADIELLKDMGFDKKIINYFIETRKYRKSNRLYD